MKKSKKLASAALSLALVGALCIPVFSFAESSTDSESLQDAQEASELSAVEMAELEMASSQGTDLAASGSANPAPASAANATNAAAANTAGTCTATIKYYENATYEEPGYEPNEDGRYFMGERVITGLSEGDVLDAWDYVVDIPGFFFFDGWPGKLTISNNPQNNVIELFYFREWSSEYTVNYYMMVGADLTASSWSGALAPKDVEFIKFDTEVFENQPYGMLVQGDAYEYRLDGKYVVDTYPPEIRVGSDADNNVINVLYVPDSTHLPDDIEIPDDLFSIEGGAHGSSSAGSASGSGGSASGASPTLPEDEVLEKDEIAGLLPDGLTEQEVDQLFKDFIGSQADAGQLQITDDMLANPVDKKEALQRIAAYRAGHGEGHDQPAGEAGQKAEAPACDHTLCIVIIVVLLILCIIGYSLYARARKRNAALQKQIEGFSEQLSPAAEPASPAEAEPREQ